MTHKANQWERNIDGLLASAQQKAEQTVNAIIIVDHPLSGKVSHFPKLSAMLERNVEHSGGKERCIQCHFEMKFAPGS
jgi:hypothetical protein